MIVTVIPMKMKSIILISILLLGMLCGCSTEPPAQVAATTLPVYQFTSILCEGTGLTGVKKDPGGFAFDIQAQAMLGGEI